MVLADDRDILGGGDVVAGTSFFIARDAVEVLLDNLLSPRQPVASAHDQIMADRTGDLLGSMHYEGAPRFRRSRLDVAPPPPGCAVQGLSAAAAALGSNCSSVSGGKGLQESIGKSAGDGHFTLRGSQR